MIHLLQSLDGCKPAKRAFRQAAQQRLQRPRTARLAEEAADNGLRSLSVVLEAPTILLDGVLLIDLDHDTLRQLLKPPLSLFDDTGRGMLLAQTVLHSQRPSHSRWAH